MSKLTEPQRSRIVANARHADKLISDVEAILASQASRSPFPRYVPDASPYQARLVLSYLNRFRDHLAHVLKELGIYEDPPQIGMIHSIRVALTFIRISVQEMSPEQLRGYGTMGLEIATQLRGLTIELEAILSGVEQELRGHSKLNLAERLARFEEAPDEAATLILLNRIVEVRELGQFRGQLLELAEKLESRVFEIAVFGRVSSGKSSLLNRFLQEDVLPVGVNPITAVATRIVSGTERQLAVTFLDRRNLRLPLDAIAEYVTEEHNPGNTKEVIRVEASLPNAKLGGGFVLVDTPGLGSLAARGTQETLSYLPRADHAVVLISAVTPINDDDLHTIRALQQAGITISVLLSKADMIPASEAEKALRYTEGELRRQLDLSIPVFAVSTAPGHSEVLEQWFTEHLIPLAKNHREQALLAVRRKVGMLRQNVIDALRTRLGNGSEMPAETRARLESAEAELREAASEIEDCRRFSLEAVATIRLHAQDALATVTLAIYDCAKNGRSTDGDLVQIFNSVAESSALDAASVLLKRLQRLARDLRASLSKAAFALGKPPVDIDMDVGVREIPRFDLAEPNVSFRIPRMVFLWPSLAKWWIRRTVTKAAGEAIEQSFHSYSRAIEFWTRQVLAELNREFHRQADVFRGELAAKLSGHRLKQPEKEAIKQDLELLGDDPVEKTSDPSKNSP